MRSSRHIVKKLCLRFKFAAMKHLWMVPSEWSMIYCMEPCQSAGTQWSRSLFVGDAGCNRLFRVEKAACGEIWEFCSSRGPRLSELLRDRNSAQREMTQLNSQFSPTMHRFFDPNIEIHRASGTIQHLEIFWEQKCNANFPALLPVKCFKHH